MGISDLLASVANSAAAEANAPVVDDAEETEAVEGEETAQGEGTAADDLAEKVAGEEDEDKEEEDPAKAEAEADRLRQADYTRKTQALAEERKRLYAELESERAEIEAQKEEWDEVRGFLQGLKDPENAEYLLRRYFGGTVDALRNKWIAESGEESQMTERERAALARVRQLEVEDRARKEDDAKQKARWEKQQQAQKTNELRAKFNAWLPEAAKGAGLDVDEDTLRLISNELGRKEYHAKMWTQDVFLAAAKAVAKAIKKGAPAVAPAPAKPPPPLKGPGAKAPPGPKVKPAAKKTDSEDYFKKLREKYGTR